MHSSSFLWHLLEQERLCTSPAMSQRTAHTIAILIRSFRKQYRKKELRIVEIGTAHGFSTLSLAQTLSSDDSIWSLEYCLDNHIIASYNHRVLSAIWAQEQFAAPKIHFLHCDGAIFPKKELWLRNRIDVLIIDAQKTQYETYIQTYFPFLAKTCLIIADDVVLFRHKIPDSFFAFFENKKEHDHCTDEIWTSTTYQTDPDDGIFVALRRKDTFEQDILDDSFSPLYGCSRAL